MLLSFGFGFLPNAALRIAFGLLSTHAVILGWSQCKKKAATMLPLLGSFGAFLFFVLLWGGIMKINEGVPNNGEGQVADQVYESAKAALGYGLPVMLPLMGITRTLIELFPEK